MARRPKTDQRTAQRARIVLDCAAGLSNTAVAAKRGVTLPTAGKWRQRFLDGRLGALGDAPRSGQPRKLTDAKVEAVVTRTLETRPKNATHWSTRTMAEASGLNQNAIVRIWRAFGLKPHLQENFQTLHRRLLRGEGARHRGPLPEPARANARGASMKRARCRRWTAATGKVIGQCQKRHRQQEFVRFLDRIERTVPAGLEVHLVLDNYATHQAPKVAA